MRDRRMRPRIHVCPSFPCLSEHPDRRCEESTRVWRFRTRVERDLEADLGLRHAADLSQTATVAVRAADVDSLEMEVGSPWADLDISRADLEVCRA